MFGLKDDWAEEERPRHFFLEDYEGAIARWCPGCGDHAVLSAVQRLCRDEQLPPEKTVVVSGIGCSSRFPHYMKTYGFHGLHGRALPVACGIRSRRPDVHMFVATGDGDNCSIGTAHWVHAVRYNMRMVVMLFDNNIYGLTKNQTSPTTHRGFNSMTHPHGAWLSPLNPLSVTLGITNASFVAQTVDWNPIHLYATIREGFHHPGLAFIRILQRCPHFTASVFEPIQRDPSLVLLLEHGDGIPANDTVRRIYKNRQEHDPSDRNSAQAIADRGDCFPIGLLYRNRNAERYDEISARGLGMTGAQKVAAVNRMLDRFLV
ncbi:MAG: 2-oxoglutarate oxidoreductase [Candidatus Schekmanbacteria bacterium]|nr:2-oxoglutarate oxidoreductase [Candidatus Schekmanbacteria bacterium]